jgi:hypothetical protein
VLQAPPNHLIAQPIGIFPNGRCCGERVFDRPVCLGLLPDVLVVMNQPLIRHLFDTHRYAPVNQKALRNITSRSPAEA